MRKTRAWKHNGKQRHQWGTAKTDKRNTEFMDVDIDVWESEMQYEDTDDGIEEEV